MDRLSALTSSSHATAADPAASPDRVRTLAAEFEALLLGQMLRVMRGSLGESQESGFGDGPLADTVFTELSLALSRAGGLGVAAAMAPALAAAGADAPVAPPAPAPIRAIDPGRVTSSYGWRTDPFDGTFRFHRGLDVAMPTGTEVPAARGGRVLVARDEPGHGLTVVVDHGGGLATRYSHLSALQVQAGDTVRAGQVIGQSGQTGRATGPHLHFEVTSGGRPIDPVQFWAGRPDARK